MKTDREPDSAEMRLANNYMTNLHEEDDSIQQYDKVDDSLVSGAS